MAFVGEIGLTVENGSDGKAVIYGDEKAVSIKIPEGENMWWERDDLLRLATTLRAVASMMPTKEE